MTKNEDTDHTKHKIVQSNALIEGQYKLDVMPQKILRHLIAAVKPNDSDFAFHVYRLTARIFAEILGREYGGSVIEDIKDASEKLLKTQITIKHDDNKITRTSWIASYTHHTTEGWFEYRFSVPLERELLDLKNQLTSYQYLNVARLKSQYSIRIYELVRQYLNIGRREIEIEELKSMLGIGKNEYRLYGKLKQAVLMPAHREIITKTDIEYKWRPLKNVRKVVGIEFFDIETRIIIKEGMLTYIPKEYQKDESVLKNIKRFIVSEGETYVLKKLVYLQRRKAINNYPDYLYATLEHDYGKGREFEGMPTRSKEEKVVDGMIFNLGNEEYRVTNGEINVFGKIKKLKEIEDMWKGGEITLVADAPFSGPPNPIIRFATAEENGRTNKPVKEIIVENQNMCAKKYEYCGEIYTVDFAGGIAIKDEKYLMPGDISDMLARGEIKMVADSAEVKDEETAEKTKNLIESLAEKSKMLREV